jgi:bile acid:Na+ symporter, BASS family
MEGQTITIVLILKLLLLASVFLIVFALALRASRSDALFMFTHPGAAFRAFAAMYLIVPAVAVALALAFDLKPVVKVALVAIALSPMPPILPGKQLKAGAQFNYVTGLLFGVAVMSVVIAPLGLLIVDQLTPADLVLNPAMIAPPIILSTALPLVLGVIGRRLLGAERADHIAGPISKFATIMLAVGVIVLIVALAPAMWQVVGDGTIIALAVMILAGIAAGYWLAEGGPADKSALALAASARHPGVAIAIAVANFPDNKMATATILLGTLLSVIIAIPFLKRLGSRTVPAG